MHGEVEADLTFLWLGRLKGRWSLFLWNTSFVIIYNLSSRRSASEFCFLNVHIWVDFNCYSVAKSIFERTKNSFRISQDVFLLFCFFEKNFCSFFFLIYYQFFPFFMCAGYTKKVIRTMFNLHFMSLFSYIFHFTKSSCSYLTFKSTSFSLACFHLFVSVLFLCLFCFSPFLLLFLLLISRYEFSHVNFFLFF